MTTTANETRTNRLDVLEEIREKVSTSAADSKGSGATTGDTPRVVLATDSPTVADLAAINAKLPTKVNEMLPVEVLGKLGKAWKLTAGTVQTSQTLTATTVRLRLLVRSANVRVAVGIGAQAATNTSGTTTSHLIMADTCVDVACAAGSTISVIRDSLATVDGILDISELA